MKEVIEKLAEMLEWTDDKTDYDNGYRMGITTALVMLELMVKVEEKYDIG